MRIDEPSTRCSAIDDGPQTWNYGAELLQNIDVLMLKILSFGREKEQIYTLKVFYVFSGWQSAWDNRSDWF